MQKDPSTSSISPDVSEDTKKQALEHGTWPSQPDVLSYSSSNQGFVSREDSSMMSTFSTDRDYAMTRDTISNHRDLVPERKQQEWVSSPRWNVVKEDRQENYKDYGGGNEENKVEKTTLMPNITSSSSSFKEEQPSKLAQSSPKDTLENGYDSQITAILEVIIIRLSIDFQCFHTNFK